MDPVEAYPREVAELLARLAQGPVTLREERYVTDHGGRTGQETSKHWIERDPAGGYRLCAETRFEGAAPVTVSGTPERLDEAALRARLIEDSDLAQRAGLSVAPFELAFERALGELRGGRVYRSGGADHRPGEAFVDVWQEELRGHPEGGFVAVSSSWQEGQGGTRVGVRRVERTFDEAQLREAARKDPGLARLLCIEPP